VNWSIFINHSTRGHTAHGVILPYGFHNRLNISTDPNSYLFRLSPFGPLLPFIEQTGSYFNGQLSTVMSVAAGNQYITTGTHTDSGSRYTKKHFTFELGKAVRIQTSPPLLLKHYYGTPDKDK
jgi:hypothetical protein